MTFLFILAAILAAGLVTFKYTDYDGIGFILNAVGGVGLAGALLCLPFTHLQFNGEIQEFKSVQVTLENARKADVEKLESAAFQVKIAEKNEWLAAKQYYNNSMFGLWVPDEVENLKPIK